ncbi:mechanosensitive ion channel family protein [Vibrio sp. Isolate30]|jgi:small-conductance mechanosensitive channel|uniref:mechanosensitive ion channel family protein n=1 Tax=Vibrio sp. Isolate30 TaxID=2908536 RepID=UPI001EFE39BD|nr:mechanosensitive ion channel family protein [Vibrio sp. Isolate30]MCG9633102.1 mechanosensitive ion channel family protein [Vibrio sp. Isolate30]
MEMNLSFDIEKFNHLIEQKLEHWLVETIKLIPNIIVAFLTLFAFIFIANLGGRLFRNLSDRVVDSKEATNLLASIVKVGITTVGFFVALDFIGLQGTVTSLLAGAGILGLAIGFAFQDMTENLISGITMSIRKPFKIGDIVESNGVMGQVIQINLRNTLVETFSGQQVMIPNKMVFRNILTNYSRKGVRKIEIPVGISYADSPTLATKVITEAINQKPYVSNPNETAVHAVSFSDSSINLLVWFWIDYPGDYGYMEAQNDSIVAIKESLSDAGVTIPFPIRTLDFEAKGGESLSSILSNDVSNIK